MNRTRHRDGWPSGRDWCSTDSPSRGRTPRPASWCAICSTAARCEVSRSRGDAVRCGLLRSTWPGVARGRLPPPRAKPSGRRSGPRRSRRRTSPAIPIPREREADPIGGGTRAGHAPRSRLERCRALIVPMPHRACVRARRLLSPTPQRVGAPLASSASALVDAAAGDLRSGINVNVVEDEQPSGGIGARTPRLAGSSSDASSPSPSIAWYGGQPHRRVGPCAHLGPRTAGSSTLSASIVTSSTPWSGSTERRPRPLRGVRCLLPSWDSGAER